MARPSHRDSMLLRIAGIATATLLAVAVSGCVVYPAGPGYGYGYYHPYYFHFDHDHDHDRGWH